MVRMKEMSISVVLYEEPKQVDNLITALCS